MWTIDQIEHEWIGANVAALARPADRVIEAFDRVESVLGRDWMERSRGGVGESKPVGTNPALVVVKMGEHLTLLDGVNGAERLIERIRKGDLSAQGELCAIYLLLRSQKPHVASVDLYPAVGNREADFRVKLRDEKQWTYVEVTQLDESEAHERAREIVQRIATIVKEIQHSVALEAFLRRIPTDSEITAILARIPTFCGTHAASREDLPNSLGFLSLNQSAPGQVVVHDHAGEENVPRLGVAKAISGKDEIPRHVSVRMAFTDDRAVKMLHDEAGQLSTEAPGLIMAGVARATGAIRTWEPALSRRFQPEIHTRVGAVFLWMGGMCQTPRGEDQLFSTRLIVNPHAKLPLPSWMSEALDGIGDEFGKIENPAAG